MIAGNSQHSAGGATTAVLVAARDLDAGTLIGEGDMRPVEWPVADGSHWIGKRSDLVGKALLSPVAKDEPFAESRLAPKGAGAGVASRIPPGMRVVAVHVDELTGLSRFILVGMHVDVISTGASQGQNGQGMAAHTILQNIEVFSTGQSAERDPKEKPAAAPFFNLLVTPQQAEALSLAVAQGRIELVLRNPLDKGNFLSEVTPDVHQPSIPIQKVRAKFVRASRPVIKPEPEKSAALVVPPPLPPPPVPTVEVIHGTKRTVSAVAVVDPEPK
jgi:pilus assembly protein CpaB